MAGKSTFPMPLNHNCKYPNSFLLPTTWRPSPVTDGSGTELIYGYLILPLLQVPFPANTGFPMQCNSQMTAKLRQRFMKIATYNKFTMPTWSISSRSANSWKSALYLMSIDVKFSTIVALFRCPILCHTTMSFLILWSDTRNNAVITSEITGVSIVYSTVCSGAGQRIYQSSASLGIVREFHPWPVNSPHTGPITRKLFPFDVAILDAGNCMVDSPKDDIPQFWCNFGNQEQIFIFVCISYRVIKRTVTHCCHAFKLFASQRFHRAFMI